MPTRPPSRCRIPDCAHTQPCPVHPALGFAGTRRLRLPKDWPRVRLRILRRDGHQCYSPYPDRCIGRATEVDHVIPGDDHREANLRAICAPCHRTKSASEGQAARGHRSYDRQPR